MTPFNPNDPAFIENPYPFYAMGRQLSPLYIDPIKTWLVFGYDDALAILRDAGAWSSDFARGDSAQGPPPMMLFADPPRHTRLRSLVSQAFTPRMVDSLEPRIAALAEELLDTVVPAGQMDVAEALSSPLPVIVIAEILGIPGEDREHFKRWSDEAVASLGGGLDGARAGVSPGTLEEMGEYFGRMAEARRRAPREDLISGLVAAQSEGSKLDAAELLSMAVLLMVAGNETTTNLIGNAVQELMAHPDQLELLLETPALLPSAIEEVLRYSSPVQAVLRRAVRDVAVGAKTVMAGQQVVPWLGSVNRDPAAFSDADRFKITRTPNRHLAFGHGIHFCLGAPLARMEARIVLEAFLRRCRNFHRTDVAPLPRVPTFVMRGVRSLPIAFDPP